MFREVSNREVRNTERNVREAVELILDSLSKPESMKESNGFKDACDFNVRLSISANNQSSGDESWNKINWKKENKPD